MYTDKYFLTKDHMTTLVHPPLFPDLALGDFYVFRLLGSALEKGRFRDATDRIKNAKEEMKSLSQNDFQECFQYLISRWQKSIVAQGYSF
jgi:hypothetical protein